MKLAVQNINKIGYCAMSVIGWISHTSRYSCVVGYLIACATVLSFRIHDNTLVVLKLEA